MLAPAAEGELHGPCPARPIADRALRAGGGARRRAGPCRTGQRGRSDVDCGSTAFPNAKALPLQVGIGKGIFAKRGLKVELELTESSKAQRDGLAAGKFQIAHSRHRQRGRHDRGRQAGRGHPLRRRQRHERVLRAARHQLRSRTCADASSWSTRPTPPMRCRSRRCCCSTACKHGDYTIKPVGAGVYRFKAHDGGQEQRRRHPQSAVHRAGRAGRDEEPRAHHRSARPLSGARAPSRCAPGRRRTAIRVERYLAAYVESLRWVRDPANRAESGRTRW